VTDPAAPMRRTPLFLLTVCHFLVDTYSTMLAPILPLLILKHGLSNAAAGLLGTVGGLIGMTQPLLGLWADRLQRAPTFVVVGAVLAAVFTPLLGVTPNYPLTVLALALGGLGVAAFHPSSFAMASALGGSRRTFSVALFIFGGTIALGLTPLWITRFAGTFGLERLPWLTVPGVVLVLIAWRGVPTARTRAPAQSVRGLVLALAPHARVLLLITAIVTLRSVTSIAFSTFLAVLEHERGVPAADAGRLPLSLYLTSGVVGGLIAGYLADRIHPKPLVWGGLLLAAPLLWAYLQVPAGWIADALLVLGGAMILSSNSVLVTIAQEAAPHNPSLVSSLPQGFAWGLGGLTLPLIGHVADRIGMQATLSWLAWLPLVGAAAALWLPNAPQRAATRGT
jgi:MFS transporter, FSR family, fosmidomycin resistance protein